MPNLGPVEILLLIFPVILIGVGFPVGVGYWCMTLYRGKGRSPGTGFALGVLLTFFFSLIGAAIAVAISYGQSSMTLIATFGPTSGWLGKTITYDKQGFVLSGVGRISAQDVLSYDDQDQTTWAHNGMRDWVAAIAAQSQPVAI